MNKIYKEFYQKKLFTLDQATKIIKNNQIARNSINRLYKQGLIKRLKAGIYYIQPLDKPEFYPDPIHIASTLRKDAVISSNSALKALGLISSTESITYLSSTNPTKLRIDRNTFRIIKGYNFGIDSINYHTDYGNYDIKVTDLERTLLDCLRTRSMKGIELITLITEKKPQINMRRLQNHLERYNMPILYSKMGLILEACKLHIKVDESDLEKIKKKLTKKINYYKERGIRLARPRYLYNKDWNIMIPESLNEKIQSLKPIITA